MKKKKPALTPTEFAQVVDAHNEASQHRTPQIARHALLAQPIQVAGLTVHPPSLLTQILLEEIDHPILRAAAARTEEDAQAVAITSRDILTLIFIFTQPDEAWRTIGMSKENFAASARDFGMSIPAHIVAELVPAIQGMLRTANRAIPAEAGKGSEGAHPLG